MFQITVEADRRQCLAIDIDRIEVDQKECRLIGFSGETRERRDLVDHHSTLGALLGPEMRHSILAGHTQVLRLYCGPGQELRMLPAPMDESVEPIEMVAFRHGAEVSLDRMSLIDLLSLDQQRHLERMSRRPA